MWWPMTIAAGRLKPLPLAVGGMRKMALYVVLTKGETAGPAARQALELFQRHVPPAAITAE